MPIPFTFDDEHHVCRDMQGNFIASVTQVMNWQNLTFDFKRFVKPDVLSRRGKIGTDVHYLTDIYDRDGHVDPTWTTIDTHGYLESYIGFRKITGFVPKRWSHRMCELLNGVPVTGELDKQGFIGKYPAIVDLKTGERSDSHGIQLAAYELLESRSTRLGRYIRIVAKLHADGSPGTAIEYGETSPKDGLHYGDLFLAALHCTHYALKRGYLSEKEFLELV